MIDFQNLDYLTIALIVLVLAAIWAIVELALTLRRARSSVVEVVDSANVTIEQLQPVISKIDGMMDELEPAIKKIDPLIENANKSVEEVPALVTQVNTILDDVSSVSGVASTATNAVSGVVTNAVSNVSGAISRIANRGKSEETARIAETSTEPAAAPVPASEPETAPVPEPVASDTSTGYVVYSSAAPEEPVKEETPADGEVSE